MSSNSLNRPFFQANQLVYRRAESALSARQLPDMARIVEKHSATDEYPEMIELISLQAGRVIREGENFFLSPKRLARDYQATPPHILICGRLCLQIWNNG